jgi:metal-responsive CopG/Arc/MetJ family transcriptional regulator
MKRITLSVADDVFNQIEQKRKVSRSEYCEYLIRLGLQVQKEVHRERGGKGDKQKH